MNFILGHNNHKASLSDWCLLEHFYTINVIYLCHSGYDVHDCITMYYRLYAPNLCLIEKSRKKISEKFQNFQDKDKTNRGGS